MLWFWDIVKTVDYVYPSKLSESKFDVIITLRNMLFEKNIKKLIEKTEVGKA